MTPPGGDETGGKSPSTEPVTANTSPAPSDEAYQRFRALLESRGVDSAAAIQRYRYWKADRGFLGSDPLLGLRFDEAPARYYETLDEGTLHTMADSGDTGATQELAGRSLLTDPFEALDWYRRAAASGSTYAMLQIASLLATLAAVDLAGSSGDEHYAARMKQLRRDALDGNLELESLAWTLAAIRDGGAAIAQPGVLHRIARIAEAIDAATMTRVCDRSVHVILEVGLSRRAQGMVPMLTQPPPVFLRPADLYDRLPCRDTPFPIEPLITAAECVVTSVDDGTDGSRQLWICETP